MKKLSNIIGVTLMSVYCNIAFSKANIVLGTSGMAEAAGLEAWFQQALDFIINNFLVFALVVAVIVGVVLWVFDAQGRGLGRVMKAVVGILFVGTFIEFFVVQNLT